MPGADALETLNEYERLASQLLAVSDRGALERAARVLASYVGHYQLRHGPIGTRALAALGTPLRSAEQIANRVEAMRVLAAALTVAGIAALEADDTP